MAFKRGGIEAAQQLKERGSRPSKEAKRSFLLFAERFSAINLLLGCVCHGDASEKCGRWIQKRLEQLPGRNANYQDNYFPKCFHIQLQIYRQ